MKSREQLLSLLLASALLAACSQQESGQAAMRLKTSRLPALSVRFPPALPLRWPQFFFVTGPHRFLWGERGEIFQMEALAGRPALIAPRDLEVTRGMDRLIAAARTPGGTLAVLDAAGRVSVGSAKSGTVSRFTPDLKNRPGALAVTEDAIYLLLQGDLAAGSAVVAFNFAGAELGRWGDRPAHAFIQVRLNGGGIAACPDGSIFYSYINSPQILQIERTARTPRALGRSDPSFEVLPPGAVRRALAKSRQAGTVTTMATVKLGLSASRVMALLCSPEGLLFRQVARPAGSGEAYVEVWDPHSASLAGIIPVGDRVLLDVRDQVLYLGSVPERRRFLLEPRRFHLARHQAVKAAG